jgi:hypothetical protein
MALYALWTHRLLGDGYTVHGGFAWDLDLASRRFSAHTLD